MSLDTRAVRRRSRSQVPRRRGALSGLALIVLGAWGAVVPFVGPYFDYAYSPNSTWTWTSARGWLEVLPGAVAVVGGLLMLTSSRRASTLLGAWLAVLAGAWFAVGPSLADLLHIGRLGVPVSNHKSVLALEPIGFFFGLAAVIVFVAAVALGRLSVRTQGDIRYAERNLESEAVATDADSTDVVETPAERRAADAEPAAVTPVATAPAATYSPPVSSTPAGAPAPDYAPTTVHSPPSERISAD